LKTNPLNSNWRWLAIAAALLGLSAVALGAAGSHAIQLADAVAENRWAVALQIHFFQAAALLALAALSATIPAGHRLLVPCLVQLLGTLLFCGNLYLRAVAIDVLPGWTTPMGGIILLLGWVGLFLMLVTVPISDSRQP